MVIGLSACAQQPMPTLTQTPPVTTESKCLPGLCLPHTETPSGTVINTATESPTATGTATPTPTETPLATNSFSGYFTQDHWLLADHMDRVYYPKTVDSSQNRLNLSKYGIFTSLDNAEINDDGILIIGHSSGFDGYVLRGARRENFSEEEYLVVIENIAMEFNNKCPVGSYCDVDLFVGFGDPQQNISEKSKPLPAYDFGSFVAFRKWRDSNLEGHYAVCVLKSLKESCGEPVFETTNEDEFAAEEWVIRFSKKGGTLYYSVEMDETTVVPKTSVPSNNLRYFWIGYKLAGTATVNATITIPEEITCMR
jgi:hypothetical protein